MDADLLKDYIKDADYCDIMLMIYDDTECSDTCQQPCSLCNLEFAVK